MSYFPWKQHRKPTHKTLRVPSDDKTHANAEHIATQKERIGREARKGLFRLLVVSHYGILNRLRTIGVVGKVFTQSRRQMPDTYNKKSQNDSSTKVVKSFPQMGFDHRYEKRGEE